MADDYKLNINELVEYEVTAKPGQKTSSSPLHPVSVTVYPQRWYIMVVLAILSGTQGAIWNTWGPLSNTGNRVFGWTEGDIALLSNWGPIMFLISSPFFAWLMDVKGLRCAALLTSVFVATGAGLRCITTTNPTASRLIHLGHMLNGLGGPVAMGAASLLSAVWFPAYQRTTATAFIAVLNGLGTSVSFIIGPMMVPYRIIAPSDNASAMAFRINQAKEASKKDILNLMYVEFGFAGLLFLLILLYFPKKPPHPPSVTAAIERVDFSSGLKELLRHKGFWILAAPYAIAIGVYNCWISVLTLNLKPLGISEAETGWLGFEASCAGNIAGLFIGAFADLFKRRMKLYMLVLFWGAGFTFTILTLITQHYIPMSTGLLYPSLMLGAVCMSGTTPIFYESCCETTYPIAEGITASLLTWLNNVTGFVFLLIMMIPELGTSWTNWCLTISTFLCIPVLCMVKEKYARLDVENQQLQPRTTGKQD